MKMQQIHHCHLVLDFRPMHGYIVHTFILLPPYNLMTFNGKTAIVTGGTGILGKAIVERLFDEGSSIAIPYHSSSSLSSVPQKISSTPSRFYAAKVDLAQDAQVSAFTKDVAEKFGKIDFLIAAAGGYAGGNLTEDVDIEEFEGMLTINLRTTFLICRSVLARMRRQKSGRIVTVASMPAVTPSSKKGPYAISKRGVITLTETIAAEVKGTGITANVIAPSILLTEANKKSMPDADISKWVTLDDVASLVAYLCSDKARSISGNVVKIYGGV